MALKNPELGARKTATEMIWKLTAEGFCASRMIPDMLQEPGFLVPMPCTLADIETAKIRTFLKNSPCRAGRQG
jgi:hypothetical protein